MAYGTYAKIMNMIKHSDENERYSRVKDILSEMVATTKTKEENVFEINGMMKDKIENESSSVLLPCVSADEQNTGYSCDCKLQIARIRGDKTLESEPSVCYHTLEPGIQHAFEGFQDENCTVSFVCCVHVDNYSTVIQLFKFVWNEV